MAGVGFGKSNKLKVKIDKDLILPENMEKLKQDLSDKGKKLFTATVTRNDDSFPVILVPYQKEDGKKVKLYFHILFDKNNDPKISQKLAHRISKKAWKQVLGMK